MPFFERELVGLLRPILEKLKTIEGNIDGLQTSVEKVLTNQFTQSQQEKNLATQLDLDVASLTTAMAQDSSDNAALITALTTAINNSTADSPTDDPAVQAVLTALATNHSNTSAALTAAGVTIPPPSSATASVVAAAAKKS
jgi:transcriptional regulator with AAA-type ATPase domain